jgi:hypothetical protein
MSDVSAKGVECRSDLYNDMLKVFQLKGKIDLGI